MTTPDTPIDYIDYTLINFPSDRITVADIRRAHPERFDTEGGDGLAYSGEDPAFTLNLVFYLERLLARAAYEAALGKPGSILSEREVSRADCLRDLAKFYSTYGVAQGEHHTELLVRHIESQAVAQAPDRPR